MEGREAGARGEQPDGRPRSAALARSCFPPSVKLVLESIEMGCPEPAVRRQPGIARRERFGSDAVPPPWRVGSNLDNPGLLQRPQVLRDGRLAQVEMLDQLAHRPLPVPEQVEDGLPAGVTESLKGGERRHDHSMQYRLYSCKRIMIARAPAGRRARPGRLSAVSSGSRRHGRTRAHPPGSTCREGAGAPATRSRDRRTEAASYPRTGLMQTEMAGSADPPAGPGKAGAASTLAARRDGSNGLAPRAGRRAPHMPGSTRGHAFSRPGVFGYDGR